jgi:hypothetical protein
MGPSGDDRDEMTTAAGDDTVEQAFEAWLAGRPVPSAEHRLAAFSDAVRASATAPGRPSAALAELLATGLLVDQSSPSDATARSARRAPARGRRRRLRMLGPAMFAKFLSAGVAAKAATVAGVVVVGFGTAGFTGELPDHVQQTFATVVDHATPFSAPTPKVESDEETSTDPTGTSTDTTDDSTDASTDDSSTAGAGQVEDNQGDDNQVEDNQGDDNQGDDNQGDDNQGTSADSSGSQGDDTQDGGTPVVAQHPVHPDNHGATVSAEAHRRNQARQSAAEAARPAHSQHGDDQNQATSGDDNSQGGNSADDTSGDDNSGSVSGNGGSGDSAQTAGGSSLEDSSQGGSSHGGSQHGRGHGSDD